MTSLSLAEYIAHINARRETIEQKAGYNELTVTGSCYDAIDKRSLNDWLGDVDLDQRKRANEESFLAFLMGFIFGGIIGNYNGGRRYFLHPTATVIHCLGLGLIYHDERESHSTTGISHLLDDGFAYLLSLRDKLFGIKYSQN